MHHATVWNRLSSNQLEMFSTLIPRESYCGIVDAEEMDTVNRYDHKWIKSEIDRCIGIKTTIRASMEKLYRTILTLCAKKGSVNKLVHVTIYFVRLAALWVDVSQSVEEKEKLPISINWSGLFRAEINYPILFFFISCVQILALHSRRQLV